MQHKADSWVLIWKENVENQGAGITKGEKESSAGGRREGRETNSKRDRERAVVVTVFVPVNPLELEMEISHQHVFPCIIASSEANCFCVSLALKEAYRCEGYEVNVKQKRHSGWMVLIPN